MKRNIPLLVVFALVGLLSACLPVSRTVGEEPTLPPEPTTEVQSIPTEESPGEPTCVPVPPLPDPSEEELAIFSPDPEKDWIKGPDDALVTIVEYADFQCPYCSLAAANLKALRERYPDDVRIIYRHFPLASIHDKAIPAAQAVEAAGLQSEDAFWSLHDLLYETQDTWSPYSLEEFDAWVIEQAAELGLDAVQFEADYTSEEIVALAEAAWTEGQTLGIPGTPYLRVNSLFEPQATTQDLIVYVELIKLFEEQFSECPPMTVDPAATYLATIETEKGSIVIELFPDVAPLAVNSFIFLAENGWFDGITFHRVLEGFVAQTGDPSATGYGNPGYRFSVETSPDLLFDREGLVAMANSGPENNGSQFFITLDAAPDLNGGYTIFGEVVEGMDVVRSLTLRDPQGGVDLPPGDILISVTIEEQ